MSESMIERVARALFEHQAFDADMVFDHFKDEYLGEARVAIAAMRTPTASMDKAGQAVTSRALFRCSSVWEEMIDAALEPPPE